MNKTNSYNLRVIEIEFPLYTKLFLYSLPFWFFYYLISFNGNDFVRFLFLVLALMFGYIILLVHTRQYLLLALLFITLNVFQNTIFGLAFNLNPDRNDNLMIFLGVKDILIGLLVIAIILFDWTAFKNIVLKKIAENIFIILWGVLLLFAFIWSGAHTFGKISYLRNFYYGFILYYLGKIIITNNYSNLKSFLQYNIWIAIIAVIFGILEKLLFGRYVFLNILHLDKVYQAKHNLLTTEILTILPNGREGRFATDILGMHLDRIGTTFLEPVSSSYFLAFSFLILLCIVLLHNKYYVYLLFVGFGLLLTYGKGGFIVVVLGITGMLLFSRKKGISSVYLFIMGALWVCFLLIFGLKLSQSAIPHFIGLYHGAMNLFNNFWGHGLGWGGDFGFMFSKRYGFLQSGAESTFGVIIFQLGGVGILLWTLSNFSIIRNLLKQRLHYFKTSKEISMLCLATAFMMLAVFTNGLFQENASGTQCSGVFYLLSGLLVGLPNKTE